jgi:hypothetical protein
MWQKVESAAEEVSESRNLVNMRGVLQIVDCNTVAKG